MIKYFNGTIFNSGAPTIVNTVNCIGVMNAGIALEFSLRYPKMYQNYVKKCENKEIKVGKVDYYFGEEVNIVNFPTKWHFKYPSQLCWIEDGLKDFVKTYKSKNITKVAFPKLGTLNGKLNWNEVKLLMEKYLSKIDAEIIICLDVDDADGLEKEMLNIINTANFQEIKKEIRLTKKQEETIKENLPIKRFWKIKELDGIGSTIYKKLFTYCLNSVKGMNKQISMF